MSPKNVFPWALPHLSLQYCSSKKHQLSEHWRKQCLGQTNDRTLRWTILLKIIWSILLSKTWYQKYLSRHYGVVQNCCCGNASSAFISTMWWYWAGDHFSPFYVGRWCKNQLFWVQTSFTAFYSYLQILFFFKELKLWGKEEGRMLSTKL